MLTVEEIENISFRRSGLGGYKIEDVDNFVDGVIDRVKELELSNKELERRIEQLNQKLLKHEEQAESVQDAIITAERTAKKLVKDASQKADAILSEANEKAARTVADADEKALRTVTESDARAKTILDSALTHSAASIDENNRIIEYQKQQIIQIQSEVTHFRNALMDLYRNHMKLINSLPTADEFKQYQEKLEENYTASEPITPQAVEQELQSHVDEAVEQTLKEKTEIRVEYVDSEKVKEINEEIRTNSKAKSEFENDNDDFVGESIAEANVEEMFAEKEKTAVELPDSNAEEIMAAADKMRADANKNEEPKPTSIDELDDGIIFSLEEKTKDSKIKNKRQPIKISDHRKKK